MRYDDRYQRDPPSIKTQILTFIVMTTAFILLLIYFNLEFILYFLLDKLPPIPVQYRSYFDFELFRIEVKLVIFLFVLIYVLSRFYPIWRWNSHYSFRPLPLAWETKVAVQVDKKTTNPVDLRILNYLVNNRGDALSLRINLRGYSSRLLVILASKRLFLPIFADQLRAKLIGLLEMYQISSYPASLRQEKFYLTKNVIIKTNTPHPQEVVESLQSLASQDILIETWTTFARRKKITREKYYKLVPSRMQPTDEFYSDDKKEDEIEQEFYYLKMKIGIAWENRSYLKQLESILQASALNIRLTFLPLIYLRKIIALETLRFVEFPTIPQIEEQPSAIISSPPLEYSPEKIIGKIMLQNRKSLPFGISKADFRKGGIIAGGIGNGKTTLRLHILKHLLERDTQVIDFDIKGDAPRYEEIAQYGRVIIPKKNFKINPFTTPKMYSKKEYADILTQIMFETLPDSESITPPQRHILTEAVALTVQEEGNARDFFRNIVMVGFQSKGIVENYQDTSAQALLNKISWMQSLLGDIFWTDENTLNEEEIAGSSLFFDLSVMKRSTPIYLVRFFINIVVSRVLSISLNEAYTDLQEDMSRPRLMVFIDEAQLLMPYRRDEELTRLEEVVTTMRYKGISVIAAGVSADLMSQVLTDTGFIAQYRTESDRLVKGLGLDKDQAEAIHTLEPYSAIIHTPSIGTRGIQTYIDDFSYPQLDENEYFSYHKQTFYKRGSLLPKFAMTSKVINEIKVYAHFRSLHSVRASLYHRLNSMIQPIISEIADDVIDISKKVHTYHICVLLEGYLFWLGNKKQRLEPIRLFPDVAIKIAIMQFLAHILQKEGQRRRGGLEPHLHRVIGEYEEVLSDYKEIRQHASRFSIELYFIKIVAFFARVKSISKIFLSLSQPYDFLLVRKERRVPTYIHVVKNLDNEFIDVSNMSSFQEGDKHIFVIGGLHNVREVSGKDLTEISSSSNGQEKITLGEIFSYTKIDIE